MTSDVHVMKLTSQLQQDDATAQLVTILECHQNIVVENIAHRARQQIVIDVGMFDFECIILLDLEWQKDGNMLEML